MNDACARNGTRSFVNTRGIETARGRENDIIKRISTKNIVCCVGRHAAGFAACTCAT